MSALLTRKTIVKHFRDQYKNFTKVVWDANRFDHEGGPQDLSEFVIFEIDYLPNSQPLIHGGGDLVTRHFGFVYITIHVPILTGENRLLEIVDKVEAIFERKRLDNQIVFRSAYRDRNSNKSEYNSMTVAIRFHVK